MRMNTPTSKRRWLQFSLWTLAIAVTLCAIPCGWLAIEMQIANRQLESLPSSLVVLNAASWSDGGTITMECISDDGKPHSLALMQTMFLDGEYQNQGCFFFDKEKVPVRSELERRVIDLLKKAEVSYTPGRTHFPDVSNAEQEDEAKRPRAKLIELIESEGYTSFHRSHL